MNELKKVCTFVPTEKGWKTTILTNEGFGHKYFCGFNFLVNEEKKLIINLDYNFMVRVDDTDRYFKMMSDNTHIYKHFILKQQENINLSSIVLFDSWYSER